MSESAAPEQNGFEDRRRQRAMLAFGAAVVIAGLLYGLYWLFHARFYEDTDNAYVSGNVVQITPQVGGMVVGVNVDDTQPVKAGQPLVQIDPTDAQVALAQAEADLAQTVRQVRTLYGNNDQYSATVAARETELARAQEDFRRRQLAGGAVSREELDHARDAVKAANANLVVARTQLSSNQALSGSGAVAEHPNVLQAAARVRNAYLNYVRTNVPSPVDGYVAQRAAQVGQRVAPGSVLMSVVPLNQVWVDANFTEVRLERVRIGQPVTLTADLYGGDVRYHGKVAGFSPGTGGAFALLPAQNATGNWIKVVQRLPVRISLDPQELIDHPLRIGLSMRATIDVHDLSGKDIATAPAVPVHQTDVYALEAHKADELVAKIVQDNIGEPASAAPAGVKP
ncbi:HlyD family secretion protein [Nevskia soli]|uniref:HlyD family secretion protein n=1 Tax=Nevskia soli TaxID=418856 RepID=UPI00056CB1AA|nr:HlyD family efflux transporter periplasmic adaptor subunit [Nevskia soli]